MKKTKLTLLLALFLLVAGTSYANNTGGPARLPITNSIK